MSDLIDDIILSLQQFADPKRIEFAARSYPTKMKVIGVTVPNLKIVLKELIRQAKKWSPEQKLALTKELIDTDIFECQQLAYEFLGNDKKAMKILAEKDIDELGKNLDNWLSVDYYAALFVGYAWRIGMIDIGKIKSYLKSDDHWIRRIALVATVALNQKARGGEGDSIQTLEICKLAADDHQTMMVKAMSWALRELAKRDSPPVAKFIDKYESRLHKKIVREVKSKLNTGKKN